MAYTPLNYSDPKDRQWVSPQETNYVNPNQGQRTPGEGDLGRDNPLPTQQYFPQATAGLIQDQMGRDSSFYEKNLNHGLDNTGLMLTGSTDPMAKALEGQFAGNVNTAKESLKTQNRLGAPLMASKEQTGAVGHEAERHQNEVQNFNEQFQYQVQRQNMYNQWKAQKDRQEASILGKIGEAALAIGTLGLSSALGGGGKK